MTRTTLLVSMFAGLSVIMGCMSLEERLASNDPTIKRNAEYELVANSRQTGSETDRIAAIKRVTNTELLMEIALTAQSEQKKKHGNVPSTIRDGMAAVTKITDQNALSELAVKAVAEEIKITAIERLTNQKCLIEVYEKSYDATSNSYDMTIRRHILPRLNGTSLAIIPYADDLIPYWKNISDQRILAKIYRDGYQTLDESAKQAIIDKLTDVKILEEMVLPPSSHDEYTADSNRRKQQSLNARIIEMGAKCATHKQKAESDEKRLSFGSAKHHREKAKDLWTKIKKLRAEYDTLERDRTGILYVGNNEEFSVSNHLSLVRKMSDEVIIKLLDNRKSSGSYLVNQAPDRLFLMKMLPEDRMVATALEDIKRHDVHKWNRGDMVALEVGMGVASTVKDRKPAVKIVVMVLAHIVQYHKKCTEPFSMMSWDESDKMKVKKILAELPLSESEIGTVMCIIPSAWRYLIDRVTAECAYNILLQGKVNSAEMEVALVKKLPQSKVDMKVFTSVKTDAGKKAVMTAMPEGVKNIARETEEKAFAAVLEKAKIAAKDTFELHGFYLGMDWDDMKVVLAHHFPELEIKEGRDGESRDADYVIHLSNPRAPFCYASAKDKKIYQFNFGKKMLRKWYSYDVQDFREWARAYSRENKIDMKYKQIEKEADVTEPMDWSISYRVWFHQESYQYKHNTKEYRLTYFGEEKDFTGHGGLGGSIIKAAAASQFRYVRGDPGSLRAVIEND